MRIFSFIIALSMIFRQMPKSEVLILVNKEHPCSKIYIENVENSLCPVLHTRRDGRPTQMLRKEAATALDALLAEADKAGFDITVTSGYRSASYQERIYSLRYSKYIGNGDSASVAAAKTERYIAPPYCSEHHTGLAVDMHSLSNAEKSFADTPEYAWLCKHAPLYGFILRYPKGKESITGYAFEPWHFRYVGLYAKEITEKGLTLEEYIMSKNDDKF